MVHTGTYMEVLQYQVLRNTRARRVLQYFVVPPTISSEQNLLRNVLSVLTFVAHHHGDDQAATAHAQPQSISVASAPNIGLASADAEEEGVQRKEEDDKE